MFLEFDSVVSGTMFINADCVAQLSIGTPEQDKQGNFYHEVHLTYKPGHEGLSGYFRISEDALPHWLEGTRRVLNSAAFSE